MEKLNNQVGYLVLKNDDGTVLESGGELENDERSAAILLDLVHLTESVDENFMPNSSCERISIVYETHTFNICMSSNQRIYIVKLRGGSIAARSRNNNTDGGLLMYADDNGINPVTTKA